ncbi:MAG: CbtB-domain containing protein [Chloroflexi bacterium]|nr:CbtB-domain containing protein [Chloroflexota bacterium]
MANSHVTRTLTRLQTIALSLTAQITLFLFLSMLVIWTLLFSSYPAVHDPFHALRHALYLIPCH